MARDDDDRARLNDLSARLNAVQREEADKEAASDAKRESSQGVGIGMRIGIGVAWLVVVAAEMIALRSGLGYLIIDSRNAGNRYDLVIASMIIIGVIGLLLDGATRLLERMKTVKWRYVR